MTGPRWLSHSPKINTISAGGRAGSRRHPVNPDRLLGYWAACGGGRWP
jgi:hypothetical protein